MARYKVLMRSFINNHICGPEEAPEFREVEYAGKPGSNLEYISGEKFKGPAEAPKPKHPAEIELEQTKLELEAAKAEIAALKEAPPSDESSDDLS